MSWRSDLEDKYTVICFYCGHRNLDSNKKPRQKYIIGVCPQCKKDYFPGKYISKRKNVQI